MRDREPLTRRETYVYERREFQTVLHRQNSLAVFDSLEELGIFFYRGDSSEGGDVAWLSADQYQTYTNQPAMLPAVLNKLVSGGLLITDGSRIDEKQSQVAPIGRFLGQSLDVEADQIAPFEAFNCHFQLLGTLTRDRFKGPTLVWRVTK